MDKKREHCKSKKQINSFIFKFIYIQNENVFYVASLYKGFILGISSPSWSNYDIYMLNDIYLWHSSGIL